MIFQSNVTTIHRSHRNELQGRRMKLSSYPLPILSYGYAVDQSPPCTHPPQHRARPPRHIDPYPHQKREAKSKAVAAATSIPTPQRPLENQALFPPQTPTKEKSRTKHPAPGPRGVEFEYAKNLPGARTGLLFPFPSLFVLLLFPILVGRRWL